MPPPRGRSGEVAKSTLPSARAPGRGSARRSRAALASSDAHRPSSRSGRRAASHRPAVSQTIARRIALTALPASGTPARGGSSHRPRLLVRARSCPTARAGSPSDIAIACSRKVPMPVPSRRRARAGWRAAHLDPLSPAMFWALSLAYPLPSSLLPLRSFSSYQLERLTGEPSIRPATGPPGRAVVLGIRTLGVAHNALVGGPSVDLGVRRVLRRLCPSIPLLRLTLPGSHSLFVLLSSLATSTVRYLARRVVDRLGSRSPRRAASATRRASRRFLSISITVLVSSVRIPLLPPRERRAPRAGSFMLLAVDPRLLEQQIVAPLSSRGLATSAAIILTQFGPAPGGRPLAISQGWRAAPDRSAAPCRMP